MSLLRHLDYLLAVYQITHPMNDKECDQWNRKARKHQR